MSGLAKSEEEILRGENEGKETVDEAVLEGGRINRDRSSVMPSIRLLEEGVEGVTKRLPPDGGASGGGCCEREVAGAEA